MIRLFLQELRFRRNGILIWGLSLCLFPIIYVGLYPSFADQMGAFQEMMDMAIYKAMGISMGSLEDYMASTVTNLIPVILGIYAVTTGTGTLAGEEDEGRLELIVSLPIPRWQIVAVKTVALAIALFLILSIVAVGAAGTVQGISSQVETVITPIDMFVRILGVWPIVLAIGVISIFLGTFTPSRRIASAIAMFIVLGSYLGSNLTGMIDSLEKIEGFFLFHYFEASAQALENGQAIGDIVALLLIALVAFGLAVFFFQIRNITVGAWPWQRGVISE